jgi:hypothetical protein
MRDPTLMIFVSTKTPRSANAMTLKDEDLKLIREIVAHGRP